MHDEDFESPDFDFVSVCEDLGERPIVVHLSVANTVIAYHSPLTKEHVRCEICEKGARVRL